MNDDERAIRDLVATWMAASKRGDTETVLRLMTDDVVFMTPGREPFGKEAFAQAAAAMKDVQLDGTSEIVELQIAGDWAWLRSHITITSPAQRSGYTLTILRKAPDGRWRLFRDANLL
jgi:uncharacterized protein (TIGR02246 family)